VPRARDRLRGGGDIGVHGDDRKACEKDNTGPRRLVGGKSKS
jgi:hypothetical protein